MDATEAAIWGMPIVNFDAMRQAYFRDANATYCDIMYWSKPGSWKLQCLTLCLANYSSSGDGCMKQAGAVGSPDEMTQVGVSGCVHAAALCSRATTERGMNAPLIEATVPLDARTMAPEGGLHPGALAILAETLRRGEAVRLQDNLAL